MAIDLDDLLFIGMGPPCPNCGNPTDWLRCWKCFGDGGFDGERLMEEDPLWYSYDDWEDCDECNGEGGWWRCWECKRVWEDLEKDAKFFA